MASEAQRLIGISLKKVSQSRAHRGGVSLHKNLLVATVLQKARYIFMEEAYNMIHYSNPDSVPTKSDSSETVIDSVASGEIDTSSSENENPLISSNQRLNVPQPACVKCTKIQQNKENNPFHNNESSYGNLDKSSKVLKEKSNSFSSTSSLKRRRAAAADRETKGGVVQSVVLPKRSRKELENSEVDSSNSSSDSVLSDDTTPVASIGTTNVEIKKCGGGSAMEIDRITSLVSIFSFNMGGDSTGKLCRSVSTPDLCSAQANNPPDSIQRPFLAMTV